MNSDILISESRIKSYLSSVAPVPFSPDFKFSKKIYQILSEVNLANVIIKINDSDTPIYRPYKNTFKITELVEDKFTDIQKIQIESTDSKLAAVGWVLDHDYKGALANSSLIRGLRIRSGNIQVGDQYILQDIFKEKRFNSWSVGEFHILDDRIIANGRRDNFENNIHYENFKNRLNPISFELSKRCRILSSQRNWKKKCEIIEGNIRNKLDIIKLNATSHKYKQQLINEVNHDIIDLDSIGGKTLLDQYDVDEIILKVQEFEIEVKNYKINEKNEKKSEYHKKYQRIFEIILNLHKKNNFKYLDQKRTKEMVNEIISELN